MNPIMLQTIYYGIVMFLAVIFMELLTQGFLHKFIIVFGSLGRKCFVKIRQTTFDGLAIGKEEEGFLIFTYHKTKFRLPIPNDEKIFFRMLFVSWVDVDGEKWAISRCNYTPVSGSDPAKVENLYNRILTLPEDDDINQQRILIILLVILLVAVVGLFIFDMTLLQKLGGLQASLNQVVTQTVPTVKAAVI